MPRPKIEVFVEQELLAERGLKRCRSCQEHKPLTEFGVYARARDGKQSYCRPCVNERNRVYSKTYFDKDPTAYLDRKRAIMRRYREQKPEKYRAMLRRNNLTFNYGPDALSTYDRLLRRQKGLCAICRRPEHRVRAGRVLPLGVDHDHDSGEIRGLLCQDCNRGLGFFAEEPTRLRAALRYLARNRRRTQDKE